MKESARSMACLQMFIAVIVAAAGSSVAAAVEKPNIVLLMADDLGWGDVGFNGNTLIKTPHLDAMARAGMKFTRFYAAAPVCSPTRGSVLAGRHPYRYGVFSANVGHMRPEELTLAELLKENGYAAGHFGKWHLGTLTKTLRDSNRGGPRGAEHFSTPGDHGFQTWFSTEAKVPTWDPMLRPKGISRRTWWDPVEQEEEADFYGTRYWQNGRQVTENLRGDDSRIIMDRVVPFVRSAVKRQQPFFAVVWFHAPHLPVVAGPEYTALYADQGKYAQHYYGCITALDEQVGRLRSVLRELGISENTLLFFCADNGPEGKAGSAPGSAGPFRGRKRDLYEGGIRVPAVVEWPARVKAGSVTDFPASTSDYFPTIAQLLGVSDRQGAKPLDGVSLLDVLDGKQRARSRPLAFESGRQIALIEGRYKIIREGIRRGGDSDRELDPKKFALFDLLEDPSEQNDLSARHPDVVERMVETLRAWRQSCRRSLAGGDEAAERR